MAQSATDIVARMRFNGEPLKRDYAETLDFVDARSRSLVGGIKTAFGALAGVGVSLGLAALIREAVDTAAEFQRLGVQLEVATGSASVGARALAELRDVAAMTPFSVKELTTAFVTLKNLGLDPSEKALISYGNTAGATGKSLDDVIQAVADAATGEFERLKEFGIRAKAQGDQVTFTFKGVKTTVENDSAAIEKYLRGIGDVDFAGGMEKQAKTLGGQFSNLGDNIDTLAVKFGEGGFNAALAETLDLLMKSTAGGGDLATQLGGLAGDALSAGNRIVGSFGDIAAGAGDMVRDIRADLAGLGVLRDVFQPLADGANDVFDALGVRVFSFGESIRATLRELDAINAFGARIGIGPATDYAGDFDRRKQTKRESIRFEDEGRNFDAILDVYERKTKGSALKGDARTTTGGTTDEGSTKRATAAKQEATAREAAGVALKKMLADLDREVMLSGLTAASRERITEMLKVEEAAKKAGIKLDREQVQLQQDYLRVKKEAADAIADIDRRFGGTLPVAPVNFFEGKTATGQDIFKLDAERDFDEETLRQREADVDHLSDYFRTALNGGVDAVRARFADEIGGAISDVAAKIAVSLSNGGNGNLAINAKALAQSLKTAGIEFAIASALAPLEPTIGAISKGIGKLVEYSPIGLLQGLIFKDPKGSAALSTSGGEADAAAATGSRKLLREINSLGRAFTDTLGDIAKALDAQLADADLGTLGRKGKKFTFDPDGAGRARRQEFATAEEAQEAALRYALATKDVLTGISATSQRVLDAAGDLQVALDKVATIESIPVRLKALTDPVGAAIDALNREFETLQRTLTGAGASVAELADLEKLYGLERTEILKSTGAAQAATLRDFLNDLQAGPGSPLSLRDQERAARAQVELFRGDILGGKAIDQGAFVDAGRQLLDIEKAINGSTAAFFGTFDDIQRLTTASIANVGNATPIAEGPFAKKAADAAAATADNTSATLQAVRALAPEIAASLAGYFDGRSGFIGAARNFA